MPVMILSSVLPSSRPDIIYIFVILTIFLENILPSLNPVSVSRVHPNLSFLVNIIDMFHDVIPTCHTGGLFHKWAYLG